MLNRINIDKIKEIIFSQLHNGSNIPLTQQKNYDLKLDEDGHFQIKKESSLSIKKDEIDFLTASFKNISVLNQLEHIENYQVEVFQKSDIGHVLQITFSKKASEALLVYCGNLILQKPVEKQAAPAPIPPVQVMPKPTDIHQDFDDVLKQLIDGNEIRCIQLLDLFIACHGTDALKMLDTMSLSLIPEDGSGKRYESNFLYLACRKGFKQLAEKLIAVGASIDIGTECPDDMIFHKLTPLMIACIQKHEDVVRLLVSKGANIMRINGTGNTALMYAKTKNSCDCIMEEAKKLNVLHQLLAHKNRDKYTALDRALRTGNIEQMQACLSIENYQQYINPRLTLSLARMASLEYPKDGKTFDELCLSLRPLVKQMPALRLSDKSRCLDASGAYSALFPGIVHGPCHKKEAIKRAIAAASSLFSHPEKCVHYLIQLNQALENLSFPKLDKNSYDFNSIDGLICPVPKDNFIGIKKNHALENVLIDLFKQHDLAHHAYKWLGFIPHHIADEMIMNGDFVTESQFGSGLFHGIMSHMLQQAILIYAVLAGQIDLTYQDNGQEKKITIKEFLQGFIAVKRPSDDNTWVEVRDKRNFDNVDFCDPYRLASIVMCDGESSGLRALSDSLIDTFCKGYKKLLEAYNVVTSSSMSVNEFLIKMNDTYTPTFFVPDNLLEYALEYEKKKGRLAAEYSETYAAIPRKYDASSPSLFSQPAKTEVPSHSAVFQAGPVVKAVM